MSNGTESRGKSIHCPAFSTKACSMVAGWQHNYQSQQRQARVYFFICLWLLLTVSVTRCWNKKIPKISNICPKIAKSVLTLKAMFIKTAQKSRNVWATFVRKNAANKFISRPIWLHFLQCCCCF